jgi:hypothetical protein
VNVYFHTFGCKANQYDTEQVRQAFESSGAVVVDDPALADLAVINSCTVTNESEVKLRRLVRHVAQAGQAQTVVMGCAAALDDGSIAALPGVRAVVANANPLAVLRAAGVTVGARHGVPLRTPARTRALLKIQDGCDEHCTFCATTLARGDNRSRPVAELIAEARALAEHHAEIVLTGVHIGTYGQDTSHVGTLRFAQGRQSARLTKQRLETCRANVRRSDVQLSITENGSQRQAAPLLSSLPSASTPARSASGMRCSTSAGPRKMRARSGRMAGMCGATRSSCINARAHTTGAPIAGSWALRQASS